VAIAVSLRDAAVVGKDVIYYRNIVQSEDHFVDGRNSN
jgi:hypothetical protein